MTFWTAHVSHPGGRAENQDSVDYLTMGELGCWVLADGLGGHGGGAEASRLAVEAVLSSFRAHPEISGKALRAYLRAAQDSIEQAKRTPGLGRMKSTIVVLLADSVQAIGGNIGDSRLYLFRSGGVEYQSPDHSVPGALVRSGTLPAQSVRFHEDRNRLLRSLGSGKTAEAAIQTIRLCEGDAFLLCSDGFWEYVRELEMIADLCKATTPNEWLSAMEGRLLASAPPDSDNFSALAMVFHSAQAPRAAGRRPETRSPGEVQKGYRADSRSWLLASLCVLLVLLAGASLWLRHENREGLPPLPLPIACGGKLSQKFPADAGDRF